MKSAFLTVLVVVSSLAIAKASTFTVINTGDSGAGSFRQAITDANNNAGLDTIAFNIPGSGVHTITPTTDLPTIADPVIIDGYTQPGASPNTNPLTLGPGALGSNAVIQIELNGSGAGTGLNISGGNSTVRGLAVNRFGGNAINIGGNADGNVVEGNFLGTNPAGTVASANAGSGVRITTSSNNRIGGTLPASRNLISGNGADGVDIALSSNNLVQGNLIGTNKAGTQALGNHSTAISLNGSAINNTIGGLVSGAGNVISANTSANGIGINSSSSGNLVQGNFIGTDVSGTIALGNDNSGVAVSLTSLNNTIGGTAAGAGNLIAFNGLPANNRGGVNIFDNSTGNAVQANSIFSNAGLGIDLSADGVTPNDSGDADAGPNNLQNFPVLQSVANSGGMTTITGRLNSAANTTYRLEFFANDAIDPTGYGEGQIFIGFKNVTTNASGDASFTAAFSQIGASQRATATATDPNGNTSEFSGAIGQLLNISTRMEVLTGNSVLIGGFIIGGSGNKQVLLRALGPTLTQFGVTGVLADPTLELHDGSGALITSNDNWKDTQQAAISATGKAPPNDLESAILHTFTPGNYTAIVRGKNNTTGIGLVEAYDIDEAITTTLTNISTRGFVDTGQNVMIGGFISGNGIVRVIVRALGPTLSQFGVPNVLADPTLDVRDAQGNSLATNDNWQDSQQAEIQASGFAPPNTNESAVIIVRPAGNTTAIVSGKNNTTGNALVEVYILAP